MAGKVIDDSASGVLILIIPFALAIVLLFTAWPLVLVLVLLGGVWNVWQRSQWLKWSEQLNPIFHQLIQSNQGCLTPVDLAMKANISGMAAKRFLDLKAKEFGIRAIEYEDKGTVYYFTTGSTLNSLLDGSETAKEIAIAPSTTAAKMLVEPLVETEPPEAEPSTTSEETSVAAPVETEASEAESVTSEEAIAVTAPEETEASEAESVIAEEAIAVTAPEETAASEAESVIAEEAIAVTAPEESAASEAESVIAEEAIAVAAPEETEASEAESVIAEEAIALEEPVETAASEAEQSTVETDTPTQEQQPTESNDEEELEPIATEKSGKKIMAFGSLIQIELANRLGVHSSTVYKRRYDSDFPQWSKSRDPQGIAWEYSEDTKEFYPVENK